METSLYFGAAASEAFVWTYFQQNKVIKEDKNDDEQPLNYVITKNFT